MIEIDGSTGGGQILRTAVGLSAITNEPVKVSDIRKGKQECKPGLRLQHLTGIKVIKEFTNADAKGMEEGSMEVEFHPKKLELSSRRIDIGSAGSISLLMQTLLPVMIFGDKKIELEIKGGTETRWSPPIQYIKNVTLPIIRKLGAEVDLEIRKHGYYPKGGGIVVVRSTPTKLRAIKLEERGELLGVNIESVVGSLPEEIAKRQAESTMSIIKHNFPNTKFTLSYKRVDSLSPGTSITCNATFENAVLGGSALGERGIKAESVGISAAENLLHSMKSEACLDRYMADQILPFMALAKGDSRVTVREITNHCLTNIRVIERVLPVKFEVEGEKGGEGVISVSGTGKSIG